jgi:hypothetical protein
MRPVVGGFDRWARRVCWSAQLFLSVLAGPCPARARRVAYVGGRLFCATIEAMRLPPGPLARQVQDGSSLRAGRSDGDVDDLAAQGGTARDGMFVHRRGSRRREARCGRSPRTVSRRSWRRSGRKASIRTIRTPITLRWGQFKPSQPPRRVAKMGPNQTVTTTPRRHTSGAISSRPGTNLGCHSEYAPPPALLPLTKLKAVQPISAQ